MKEWHEVKSPCNHLRDFDSFNVIAIEAALCGKSKGVLYTDAIYDKGVFSFWNESDGFYLSAKEQFDTHAVHSLISMVIEKNRNSDDEFVLYIDGKYNSVWLFRSLATILP